MSELEWLAALLGVVNVILVVRRSIWNFPFALTMVTLYFFVFSDAKLYSDALLQIFFFAINLYGWWAWSKAPQVDEGVAVERMGLTARLAWLAGTAAASLGWGWGMATYTDAAAPFADAAVAGMSVAAQILQSLRRFEAWILWIAVDILAIGLYATRGLLVTSGLYALFLILAVAGLLSWHRNLVSKVLPQ
jgi:nicotinamide mononucleotide transporter